MNQKIEKRLLGVGAAVGAVAFIAAVCGHTVVAAVACMIDIAGVFGWMCIQMAKPAEEGGMDL